MMHKSAIAFLTLSMLLSACATESRQAANAEPVAQAVAETGLPAQVAAPVAALVEAKPVEIKAADKPVADPAVGRLAVAPDFYQCMVNWAGAMQSSLTPWTGAIKQCDTRGSGK